MSNNYYDSNTVMSPAIDKLAPALLAAQLKMGNAVKDSKNPFFKSKYADLNSIMDAVVPALTEQGLLLLQPIEGDKVVSMITDLETGELMASHVFIPSTITDPQKIGACITYFRRFTLQSLLGLQALDDDGNSISAPGNKPTVAKNATAPLAMSNPPAQVSAPTSGAFKRPLGAKTNGSAGPVTQVTEVKKAPVWDGDL